MGSIWSPFFPQILEGAFIRDRAFIVISKVVLLKVRTTKTDENNFVRIRKEKIICWWTIHIQEKV